MRNKNVWKIKNPSDVVQIIDSKYKQLLKKIIVDCLIDYPGLPVEWEDLYFEFLYEASQTIGKFKKKEGIEFQTYLGIKCKNFAKNKCKHYTGNSFAIMNNYISSHDKDFELKDNTQDIPLSHDIDLSIFTSVERKIIRYHFLEGMNVKETCKEVKITFYKFTQIKESIKTKIELQLKN